MRLLFDCRLFKPILLAGLLVLGSCNDSSNETNSGSERFFCGAENKIQEGTDWIYDDGYGKFNGGGHQVSDSVFEGKFACKIDSTNEYGMPVTFTNVPEGTFFETSVWIKQPVGKGTIVAGTTGRTKYTLNTTQKNHVKDSAGWSNYYMCFGIESPVDTLKFFLFAAGQTNYFDNFEIIRHQQRPALSDSLSKKAMHLYIPDSAMVLLSEYKAKALQQDIISSDLKEYVNGFIIDKGDSIPIEIRLKGDWTDHLENGKTSYRIKTDKAYNGLTTFSIQHPQTRNFMHEWFMHELCDMEGLLSTSYDFLPVEINGVNQGIYAIEEHFDKQVVESRKRREGPIIKIDETGFWALLASGKKDSLKGSYPYFESAMITCFKEGRTEKNPVLSDQFENASVLLTLFKNRYPHPDQIFDLKQTAKYFALMDLGNIHHSMAWHNRRFYYNPVTTKLEFIGFDMIPAIMPFNPPLAMMKFEFAKQNGEDEFALDFYLYSNPEFRKLYMNYYKLYNSESYLDSVFKLLDPEIKKREIIMQAEFPNHSLDRQFYYDRAEYNRNGIESLDSSWDAFMENIKSQPEPKIIPPNYKTLETNFLQKEISVNVYRDEIDSCHFKLQLENYHLADLTVVGYSTKAGEDSVFLLDQSIKLKRYDGFSKADYAEIVLGKKPSKIHFTVANIPGAVHSKKVFSWPKPSETHPRIELEKKFKLNSSFYTIKNDTLRVKKGNYTISEMILVPSKYVVIIEEGTTIDLIDSAALILNNSTYIGNWEKEPVIIKSSDQTSRGIVILQPDTVRIENTEFWGLGTMDYCGWNLTGAVTIYEGIVDIHNVTISNNHCEDALNIIRGNFQILHLKISNTKGDGFDADFCTGTLAESQFSNTGNDCIDFSGSQVKLLGLVMKNAGDKGVSCGEMSTMNIHSISIDGALTAIASKDGSVLTGENITAKNCETGIAIYRKKPEYAGAILTLTGCSYSEIKNAALIEKGGVLNYNGINYFGYTAFDIDEMYARFQK